MFENPQLQIFQSNIIGWEFPAYMPYGTTQVKAELMKIQLEDWVAVDRLEGYPRQLCHARLAADNSEVVAWKQQRRRHSPDPVVRDLKKRGCSAA